MVIDKETNVVYFSQLLATNSHYKHAFSRIIDVLTKHRIAYKFLTGTKDIWCRDYMPIQKSTSEFIQFKYEPSYLAGAKQLQSGPEIILLNYNIAAKYSDINLDGGNVLRWHDRVIITDRIFKENPAYTDKPKLLKELENLFEAEVIIIPQIKCDMTGHADGLVRFYDRTTLIGNRLQEEYLYWQTGMKKVIANYNFTYIDLPFFQPKTNNSSESAIGIYVNYLEINNLIIAPVFEIPGNKDEEAITILKHIFHDRIIEPININEIAQHGGLLNCITWNILQP